MEDKKPRGGARTGSGRKKIEDREEFPYQLKFESKDEKKDFLEVLKELRKKTKNKNGKIVIEALKKFRGNDEKI